MYEQATDAALIQLALHSDRSAFALLFGRHSRSVYLYSWGRTKNDHDAEDLTQEVFVIAWSKLASIRIAGESARPWLLVTARNVAQNHARKQAKQPRISFDESIGGEPSHDELFWVRNEISKLNAIDQRVCELCLEGGYSYADAARMMGSTVGALAKRVERIRGRLRFAVRGER